MAFFKRTEKEYKKKNYLMTQTEWDFFGCLCKVLSPHSYVVQPHVPLVSVIEKLKFFAQYKEELHDIVDFCIFDDDYHPLLLIEVDEQECGMFGKKKNMEKIGKIALAADIPLVTLWENYGANETYIRERLKTYLQINVPAK